MRTSVLVLTSLLGLSLCTSPAPAQYRYIPPPPAPDMCNPGFYCPNCYGCLHGPNYCVYPSFPPFQGMLLGPQGKGGPGGGGPGGPGGPGCAGPGGIGFPTHLYARSPRDFFMIDVDPANSPYSYGAGSPLYASPDRGVLPVPSQEP